MSYFSEGKHHTASQLRIPRAHPNQSLLATFQTSTHSCEVKAHDLVIAQEKVESYLKHKRMIRTLREKFCLTSALS